MRKLDHHKESMKIVTDILDKNYPLEQTQKMVSIQLMMDIAESLAIIADSVEAKDIDPIQVKHDEWDEFLRG